MNFRNLQYFLLTAEERNITRAARKLHVSQQSLSGHIAKLEEELGAPLFERGQELTLTYAGKRLQRLAGRICSLEQEARRELGEIGQRRRERLRLGVSYTCGRAILPVLLPDFCAEHPLAEIELMEANRGQLNEWLSRGEIDLMICYTPIEAPGARISVLMEEGLYLVCPRGMLPAGEEPPQALRDRPFILLKQGNRVRTLFDAWCETQDFLPHILLETENIETAFALAERGVGVTVYPELFLNTLHRAAFEPDSPVRLWPLSGYSTQGVLALAWKDAALLSPTVSDFIALCCEKAPGWSAGAPFPAKDAQRGGSE